MVWYGEGRKGEERKNLIVSFLFLPSFVLWSAYWAFPTRSAAKNG
jgi:hypothetical protein